MLIPEIVSGGGGGAAPDCGRADRVRGAFPGLSQRGMRTHARESWTRMEYSGDVETSKDRDLDHIQDCPKHYCRSKLTCDDRER